jgi:hypothetical protein
MKIPSIISNNPVLVGGALIGAVALAWLSLRGAKGMGKDIGSGAVDLVFGTAQGVGGALYSNLADPETNPLHSFGSSIGETIFNWTH